MIAELHFLTQKPSKVQSSFLTHCLRVVDDDSVDTCKGEGRLPILSPLKRNSARFQPFCREFLRAESLWVLPIGQLGHMNQAKFESSLPTVLSPAGSTSLAKWSASEVARSAFAGVTARMMALSPCNGDNKAHYSSNSFKLSSHK